MVLYMNFMHTLYVELYILCKIYVIYKKYYILLFMLGFLLKIHDFSILERSKTAL